LANAAARWHVLHIASEIIDRAKQPFPEEPIRTHDALHLASALTARAAVMGLEILSLDDRVRKSAKKLGLSLLPEKSH
jgi:predicted nucleic acid-binding protein